MNAVAVIPARYASTRFPGKPLASETGKFLVEHVYEQVLRADRIDRAVVATDDQRIADAVTSFGGEARMTNRDHPTGTDRVGEIAEMLKLHNDDLVLNVQGDEPEISPESLDYLIERMTAAKNEIRIGTIAARFDDDGPKQGVGSPLDPNCVKVVLDESGRALYFSRSPIPYPRDASGQIDQPSRWFLHLGVYAFRVDALRRVTGGRMLPTALERTESLEQLRWLGAGLSIAVVEDNERSVGIDTPEDYAAFVARYEKMQRGAIV
jgi:3-deoxy-manno-octulosonate cytidylyltransferase (CMP-KDO synthetase)